MGIKTGLFKTLSGAPNHGIFILLKEWLERLWEVHKFLPNPKHFCLQQIIQLRNFAENESCMSQIETLQLFGDKKIRTAWSEEEEKWYFSVVDVVYALQIV